VGREGEAGPKTRRAAISALIVGERIPHPDDDGAREVYDRVLQHRHGWTTADLHAEDPDVVDDLRWTLYADMLTGTATMDLEQAREDLDFDESLRRTKNEQMREAIIAGRVGRARIRIGELTLLRAGVRADLLLDEVPAGG
jgi:hypothetical protein